MEDEKYQACKNCPGEEHYSFDVRLPERCKSEEYKVEKSGTSGGTKSKIRTTGRFLMVHRRARSIKEGSGSVSGSGGEVRINSKDVNPEDIQDFDQPMVVIGSDVISLYPNLDVEKISREKPLKKQK